MQWRGKGSPTPFKTTTGTFYLNDGTGVRRHRSSPQEPSAGKGDCRELGGGLPGRWKREPTTLPMVVQKEKTQVQTQSHPRLFLWLVGFFKVVCLRPETQTGGIGGSRRGAP